jgi:predicted dehydrogenase
LYNWLKIVTENQIEHTFLLTANCIIANAPLPAWRSDPKLAGGGVLMHECYKIIDLIVSCFGLPQQVYSLNVSNAPDRKQRLYLTEDTALLTMKFSDAFVGNLVAFRSDTTEPQKEVIQVCGKNRTVTLSEKVFCITDETGRALDRFEFDSSGHEVVTEMFDSLAMNIILPDNNILQRPVTQDLNNMAVIEAAYLSARTGFPEEPAKILQMAKIEPQKSLAEQKTMRNPHLTSCSAPDNVSE